MKWYGYLQIPLWVMDGFYAGKYKKSQPNFSKFSEGDSLVWKKIRLLSGSTTDGFYYFDILINSISDSPCSGGEHCFPICSPDGLVLNNIDFFREPTISHSFDFSAMKFDIDDICILDILSSSDLSLISFKAHIDCSPPSSPRRILNGSRIS